MRECREGRRGEKKREPAVVKKGVGRNSKTFGEYGQILLFHREIAETSLGALRNVRRQKDDFCL